MRNTTKVILGAAVLAGWVGVASALEMTLDQLLVPGASMQVGDKIFDDFGWNSAVLTSHGINIKGIDQNNPLFVGNFGIDIQGSWTQFGPGTLDADLTYRVHTAGQQLISDVHQVVNGGGIGNFVASVSELVLDANGNVKAELFNGASSLGNFAVGFAAIVPPSKTLLINKDINLVVLPGGIVGSISDIQQTFSQIGAPDGGATLAMLGFALLGVEGLRRKLTK